MDRELRQSRHGLVDATLKEIHDSRGDYDANAMHSWGGLRDQFEPGEGPMRANRAVSLEPAEGSRYRIESVPRVLLYALVSSTEAGP